jgi:hypothetical protein
MIMADPCIAAKNKFVTHTPYADAQVILREIMEVGGIVYTYII